jgi:N-acetylglucosaminyldiphosphoundecaprenol N-acetyl-beta-D-mannosaminyltransferase
MRGRARVGGVGVGRVRVGGVGVGRVRVGGVWFDPLTHAAVIEHVASAIRAGTGGTIVTPNVDICRRARRDAASADLIAAASLVVPDGMPLLWAARLAGSPLPERVAGADLIFSLSESAAAGGWPVYLLGGLPGTGDQPSVAELAAAKLTQRYPGLPVAGTYAPPNPFDPAAADIGPLRADLAKVAPTIVFVGLGFPKQEQLIARVAPDLRGAWFVGCGAAIPYAAGVQRRAPLWAQRRGLEWLYRLVSEPRRLARRYLVDDLPFAARLLAQAAWQRATQRRVARRRSSPPPELPAPARDLAEPADQLVVERREFGLKP